MKRLAILGSTGSIGSNALDIVRSHPGRFEVISLAAGRKIETLLKQMREFCPRLVSVADQESAARLASEWADEGEVEILWGSEGLERVATAEGIDLVIEALAGSVGLIPSLRAIEAGRNVAWPTKR